MKSFLSFSPRSTLFFFPFIFFAFLILVPRAQAADVTVCNSSCDYTTITDAILNEVFSPGDSIFVKADYASTTETFPLNLPFDITLDCQNSGATIGSEEPAPQAQLTMPSNTTLQNCRLFRTTVYNSSPDHVTIQGNDFLNTSGIQFSHAFDTLVTNNTNLLFTFMHTVSSTVFTDNVMNTVGPQTGGLSFDVATSVTVTGNTIIDHTTSTNTNFQLFTVRNNSYDVYIATNTMSEPDATFFGGGMSQIEVANSRGVVIRDNRFILRGNGGGVQSLNVNGSGGDVAVDIQHNTIRLDDPCQNCGGILMSSWNVSHVSVTSTYNLFVATTPSSTATMTGHSSYGVGPSSSLDLYTSHEGFVGLNSIDNADFPRSADAIVLTHNPFKVDDTSSLNDLELVPYSVFLDVQGSEDIGAVPGVRGNSFHVDAAGTIDYSTVMATDTPAVMESLRNGDHVTLGSGSYSPMVLRMHPTWPVVLTGNLTVSGVPSSTFVQATSSGDALYMSGVGSSTFSDLVFTGATGSSLVTTYAMTHALFTYNSVTYNQTGFIFTPNLMLVIKNNSCGVDVALADGLDVTMAAGAGLDDWNVGLIDLSGSKVTIWVPNNLVSSGPALISYLATKCAATATVDQFIPGAIKANGNGTFSYDAGAVALASATLQVSDTNPPAITRTTSGGIDSGITLEGSSYNVFSHVTSTGNTLGVQFTSSTTGNTFSQSSFLGNQSYDVYSNATGQSDLVDSLFSVASSTFPQGSIRGLFSVRVFVEGTGAVPVQGASTTVVSANSVSSFQGLTDISGLTAFSSPLIAFVLSSTSSGVLAGGYNPYHVSSLVSGSFLAGSSDVNVLSPFQTITLNVAYHPSNTGGGGGGGGGSGIALPAQGYVTTTVSIDPTLVTALRLMGFLPHQLVKLPDDGNPRTQEDTTVYYLGIDGRRHAFPNPSVYFSWYCDFSSVQQISAQDLAKIPLGRNVTYRPGLRLVKFPSLVTVYLVQSGGVLRPIPNEAVAAQLIGADWTKYVSDISEAFYGDYIFAQEIPTVSSDRRPFDQTPSTISGNLQLDGYSEPPLTNVRVLCPDIADIGPVAASSDPTIHTSLPLNPAFVFLADLGPNQGSVEDIRRLQEVLRDMGPAMYPEGRVTGTYGPATIAAVRRFQKQQGIPQTGIVGPLTRKALNGR